MPEGIEVCAGFVSVGRIIGEVICDAGPCVDGVHGPAFRFGGEAYAVVKIAGAFFRKCFAIVEGLAELAIVLLRGGGVQGLN